MFTDSLVTPRRIEILLDLLREFSRREWHRTELYSTLQSEVLPALHGKTDKGSVARATIAAAIELQLVQEEGKIVSSRVAARDRRSSREIVLEAFDRRVLPSTEVEPWFSLFYSYLLGQGSAAARSRSGDDWAKDFVDHVLQKRKEQNPFNGDKYGKIVSRWYPFAGLGWRDPAGIFHPNPYERLRRSLPAIFGKEGDLTSDALLDRIAEHCPELDGGSLFCVSNPRWDRATKTCSLGLSHALVDLHINGAIELSGGKDSRGWSVESAKPPRQGFWDRFDVVRRYKAEVAKQ